MLPEPINLLPSDKVRLFRRGYFLRVGALAMAILAVLVGVHAVLLFPTYSLIVATATARASQLSALSATGASADEAAFNTRVAALTQSANRIGALEDGQKASSVLALALAVPHKRITLTSFAYAAATGNKKVATLALTGSAATRDDLRSYQLALQGAPFVAAADLPVATYAKDTQIPFTLTLTLTTP